MNDDAVNGTLSVRAARPTLVLRNDTSTIIGYVIVDSDAMMIMQYPPTAAGGAVLAPGEEISVPYGAISQYSRVSVAANVKWWRYGHTDTGMLEADGPLHTVYVDLN